MSVNPSVVVKRSAGHRVEEELCLGRPPATARTDKPAAAGGPVGHEPGVAVLTKSAEAI
jgi:hypothetical protein